MSQDKVASVHNFERIALVTVGTEITTGQISNSNSTWLARQLTAKGFSVPIHLSVPDDRDLMLGAFSFCRSHDCCLIVTTGGLGPTSDDFTREVVAVDSRCALVWDEASWQGIVKRLTSRGREVKDIQRKQCYFPAGAAVLENSEGTANGFYLKAEMSGSSAGVREFLTLPGPPREIEAIWHSFASSFFDERSLLIDKMHVQSWNIRDVPESEIAIVTEPIFRGSPFTIGYRVHKPFVEFKVSYRSSQLSQVQPYLDLVVQAFEPWNK